MKITRRDLGVIMILVGILSVFLTYKLSFSNTQTQIEELQSEQKSLRNQISELEPVKENEGKYKSEMERFQKELDEMVKEFPADILMEDNIMYVVELEDQLNIDIPSLSGSEAAEVNAVDGDGVLADKRYVLDSASLTFGYTVDSYDDLKEFLDYVYTGENTKRVISSVSMSFDEEDGSIAGNVALVSYAMNDGTKTYEEQDLPLDKLGVDNIFGEVVETEEAKD